MREVPIVTTPGTRAEGILVREFVFVLISDAERARRLGIAYETHRRDLLLKRVRTFLEREGWVSVFVMVGYDRWNPSVMCARGAAIMRARYRKEVARSEELRELAAVRRSDYAPLRGKRG